MNVKESHFRPAMVCTAAQHAVHAVFFLLLVSPGHSLCTPYLSNKINGFGAESTGHCQSKDRWISRLNGRLLGICFRGVMFFFILEEEIYDF